MIDVIISICMCKGDLPKIFVLRFFKISDSDGTALTNGEAVSFAIRFAQHFRNMGLKQDDVVGIVGRNTTYITPLVLGCLLNCTPFHAINPEQDEGQ